MVDHPDYYTELQSLEAELNTNKNSRTELASLQARLNELMYEYREDESLGADRFGLYQLQAMLSFRLGEFDKSKRFIDYAVRLKGSSFTIADQLYSHLIRRNYRKKRETKWWVLIILPFMALVAVALLQFITQFVLNKSGTLNVSASQTLLTTVINIISAVVGLVSVVLLLMLPLWVNRLINVKRYNENHGYGRGLIKRTGVLIAIFLPVWYWLYTYGNNPGKFWLNFILGIVTAGYWMIIGWPWAIIQASIRPEEFYALYPYYENKP
jgi:hypothetical protein